MALTTLAKDSDIGDDWIRQMCQLNPVGPLLDESGHQTGNFLTGPVRLAFTDAVFVEQPKMKSDPNSVKQFGCTILFPANADLSPMWAEYCRIAQTEFPGSPWNPHMNVFTGLDPAFREQSEKAMQYEGYLPGAKFINVSSRYKPEVVDHRKFPILDQSQIYPGVWVVVLLSAYASGKGTPRQGPRFGLVKIMKIADDKNLSGGSGPPASEVFGGVKTVTPPTGPVSAAFGSVPPMMTPQYGQAAINQIYGQPQPQQQAIDPMAAFGLK